MTNPTSDNQISSSVGFLGLGLMGYPMAHNLIAADVDLTVWNRSQEKCASLQDAGARVSASPRALAETIGDGIIIVCLADSEAVRDVVTGPSGLLEGLKENALVIDMGTTSVSLTKDLSTLLNNQGARLIDAPVSGGEVGARDGSLSIMAGGDKSDIQRAMPIFDVLGKSTTHIGPVGSGQAAKMANQHIVGSTVAIVAEALHMVREAGCDVEAVREALLGGFASSRVLDLHGKRMIDQTFTPGAYARTQLKDMKLASSLADDLSLQLPMLEKAETLWAQMVEEGFSELDQSGYYQFLETIMRDSS